MACNLVFEYNGEVIEFNSQDELNDFVFNNRHRLQYVVSGGEASFSKDLSKQAETIALLKSRSGNVSLDEPTHTYTVDGNVESEASFKGYRSTTEHLIEMRDKFGNRLFPEFIKENYIKNESEMMSRQGMSPSEIKAELDKRFEEWDKIPNYGTEVHSVAEQFFLGVRNKDTLAKKHKKLSSDVIDKVLLMLTNLENDIKKEYGDDVAYLPELKVYDESNGIAGMIDLLVIDRDGNAHIYDYKTSYKNYDSWSSAKELKYAYQQGMYKTMLEKQGLTVKTADIVPMHMNNIDYNNDKVESIDVDIPRQDLITKYGLSNPSSEVAKNIADELDTTVKLANSIVNTESMFSYDLDTQIPKSTIDRFLETKVLIDEATDARYFVTYENKKKKKIFVDEANAKEQVRKHLEQNSKSAEMAKSVYNYFERYEKFGVSARYDSVTGSNSAGVENILQDYATNGWRPLKSEEMFNSGIVIMYNEDLNAIDVIAMNSTYNAVKPLPRGNTIFGNYKTNIDVEGTNPLEASTDNMYLMKAALFLSKNKQLSKYRLNDIFSMNEKRVRNSVDLARIMSTYNELAKMSGEEDIRQFETVNPMDRVNWYMDKIINSNSGVKVKNKAAGDYAKWLKVDNFNKTAMLEGLVKVFNDLHKRSGNKTLSGVAEEDTLKVYVADAILKIKGIRTDSEYAVGKYAKDFVNSGNIRNETYKDYMQTIIYQPINIVRRRYVKYHDDKNPLISNLISDNSSAYGTLTHYTIGNTRDMYKNILEKNASGNYTGRTKEIDDPTLTKSENEFLKYFLKTINDIRAVDKSIGATYDKDDPNYRNIPMMRQSPSTKLLTGSIKGAGKEYADNMINPNDFFKDEAAKEDLESVELMNRFSHTEDLKVRNEKLTAIDDNFGKEYETNLEHVLDQFVMNFTKKQEFDKVLPLAASIQTMLAMKRYKFKDDNENSSDMISKHIKSTVHGDRSLTEGEKEIERATSVVKDATSALGIGLNIFSGIKETFTGLWGNVSRSLAQSFDDKLFGLKEWTKAGTIVMVKGVEVGDTISMMSRLNMDYGMTDMDMNQMTRELSRSETGILALKSRWLYWMNKVPDYYNRMTVLVAQMIKDGTYEAYSMKNGEMVYDQTKDSRFTGIFDSKGKLIARSKLTKEQQYKRATFDKIRRDMIAEGSMDEDSNVLPRAYTVAQSQSIKDIADATHGYYSKEDKILWGNTVFGSMFMQFKTWITAKGAQWYKLRGERSRGRYDHMVDANGNKLYLDINNEITTEVTDTPYIDWKGDINEGIVQSLIGFYKDFTDKGLMHAISEFKKDPVKKGNIVQMSFDMGVVMSMYILFQLLDLEDLKKKNPAGYKLAMAFLRSGNDLSFVNVIDSTLNNGLPAIGTAATMGSEFQRFFFNEDHDFMRLLTNTSSLGRGMKATYDTFTQ